MLGGADRLQGLEAAVVLQCFAADVAKALEITEQWRVFVDEVFVELAQQRLLGVGRRRPVDQRQLLKALKFVF